MDISTLPYRPNVGVMVLNRDGLVFVGQRKDHYSDAWQMPQGGIDKGEDAYAAALREMQEETGITADNVTLITQTAGWLAYNLPADLQGKLWGGKYRGQEQKWYLFRFTGQDSDINIETEEQEFRAWKWMDVSKLVSSIVPFKRDIYQTVLTEFEAHL